jgi:hypothetical protein
MRDCDASDEKNVTANMFGAIASADLLPAKRPYSPLVELADEVDIAKSTCSEIPHRVKKRIIKEHRREDPDVYRDIAMPSD